MRRAVGPRALGALAASVLALAACSAIIGTRDLTLVAEDAGAGNPIDATTGADGNVPPGNDGATPGTDSGSDGGGGSDAACSGDLTTDAHNCGRCGHDCLGGQCVASKCQPVTLAQGQEGASGVAVDATNVYFVTSAADTVVKMNKDGTGQTVLAHDQVGNVSYPFAIALDDQYVYWACDTSDDLDPGRVARCAKTGCNGVGTRITQTDLNLPEGLAVDDTNLFFAAFYDFAVGRANKADGGQFGFLVTNQQHAHTVAIDDASVFFTSDFAVGRLPKGAPTVLDASADASNYQDIATTDVTDAFGVAVDDTSVFWVTNDDPGLVVSAPKSGVTDGGTVKVLASNEHFPLIVALDATNVYWTATGPDSSGDPNNPSFVDSYVATCPKTGCPQSGPIVLASSLHNARYLAVDDVAVYATYQGNATGEGGVIKVAKP